MAKMQLQTGFFNRIFICFASGYLLVFVLNIKNFDLHFTLRGPQTISSDVIIAHIPPESEDIRTAIYEIKKNNPRLIVAPVNRKTLMWLNEYNGVLLIPRKSLKADADGILRSFSVPQSLLRKLNPEHSSEKLQTLSFINFRGPQNSFSTIYFYEIKNHKILPTNIKNKIVILDIQDPEEDSVITPVGELSAAELIANMIDNMLYERWITPLATWISMLVILIITTVVSLLILSLSSNLAFLGIFILLIVISSLSFMMFDQFNIWLPLTAYIVHVFISYFVFLNYKLNKKEQLAWRLEKEKAYKDEMDEMKKNFLNLFSHDLKTPIAKILGQIEILDGEPQQSDRLNDGLQKIRKYSNELNQYVKNILKISQIESNRFLLKIEPCDINSLIKNGVNMIRPLAEEKKISIQETLEPLFSINCDKDLVQQIILNILENAIKFSPSNSTINISSIEEESFVVVSVQDHGRGIKLEDQDKIWRKFYRTDDNTEGTGLGLYLVKYFVEAHDGAVFVESDGVNGSVVGFKLPLV
jgi:two-component system, OmpR family, phosphate regulon sensor histidine kinase PhoR